jgi:hypothetical protein
VDAGLPSPARRGPSVLSSLRNGGQVRGLWRFVGTSRNNVLDLRFLAYPYRNRQRMFRPSAQTARASTPAALSRQCRRQPYRRNLRVVSPLRNACAVKSATLRRVRALENAFSASASAGATTWLTNDDARIGVSVPSSIVRAARKISAAVIRRASRASLYPPCGPRTPVRMPSRTSACSTGSKCLGDK